MPADALIMLYNRLSALAPRNPQRKLVIKEAAEFYNVSPATLYRALHKYKKPKTIYRADYNRPRLISQSEMRNYCELIAALRVRTTNKKGRRLSIKECIRLLETYGVETKGVLVKAPQGLLKKSTVSNYLKRFGLDCLSLNVQPPIVRFQAVNSNDCWHFDFSPSDFKHLPAEKNEDNLERTPTLMLASVVDDRSGVTYQEYHYIYGENIITALKFLYNAMAAKKHPGFPFQGIPKTFYMDNGPVAKSLVFKRVMAYLNVEIRTHLPDGKDGRRKTARSKGKVERPFRTVKESLETLYHLHPPQNLLEANEWLRHYLERYNQEKHRQEEHSRLEDWKRNLPPEGFRAMCDWQQFSALAREPETRKVGSDACVVVNGVKYQLTHELAGVKVTLLWGLFNNELHVEYEGKSYGPFYPADGPIPFGRYRTFKKSKKEERADHIELLAKNISIPRAALSGGSTITDTMLNTSGLVEDKQASIPFELEHSLSQTSFKDAIEAKAAISRWLGYPLGRLLPEQMARIEAIILESLDKQLVMTQVKQLFEIKPIFTRKEN
ncbi:IS481 family transposase [Candidatus Jidaibacter acanthamoebae]|uniref:IS481 family transposase n=1 Tax=Candidatus Jidaibacter acanthamoebae TaxID=86105 RepID=UPI0019554288|nr:IS481 family transposase [Candidatus Jidaibacter acanthamoeba]